MTPRSEADNDIAIVGLAGRFPGAADVDALWRRLEAGDELLTAFTDEELLAAGVDASLLRRGDYVRAWGQLEGLELFDAEFFGFTPREAELTDPQQRLLLECAWEAFENAGYDPARYPGAVGVFAGSAVSGYAQELLRAGLVTDDIQGLIASEKDFLATRVAYKLDLRGPALSIQTACSTSLVAVHLACQSLLARESDLALAGGVSARMVRKTGYLYQEGNIGSPDGHCRAFDASAGGTAGGDGVALVVLKRLADALADGDRVRAVIKGSAINNDGASKVGFAAPSVEGQARVIAEALEVAGVHPESIGYVEAHGTGTVLGDPIEVAALTQAFRGGTTRRGFCGLGSIKTNLGHLDAAAGVVGLLKAALCLERGRIPASLHFTRPNAALDLDNSPFRINATLSDWPHTGHPRRAGVSSFGIGGTNAHAVLEQAPAQPASARSPRAAQLLLLSARSGPALAAARARLSRALAEQRPDLADAAYTLALGRRHWPHRCVVACHEPAGAVQALEQLDATWSGQVDGNERGVVFVFPGNGVPQAEVVAHLRACEPVFREQFDACAAILRGHGVDVRAWLEDQRARGVLGSQPGAQPLLFAFSYALARLWMAWGLRADGVVGHGLGEYVAACLAGVFSLEDALRLVVVRARLVQALPPGVMLAVPLGEDELRALLAAHDLHTALDVAAVDARARCVVSGSEADIAALEARLAARGRRGERLASSHAWHSARVGPVSAVFRDHVGASALRPAQMPLISSVSGTWMRADEACNPDYWSAQMRATVRFADGVEAARARFAGAALLEVGPGRTVSAWVDTAAGAAPVVASLDNVAGGAELALRQAVGQLWLAGVAIDWTAYYAEERRQRVPLPTYPFERRRHWVLDRVTSQGSDEAQPVPTRTADPATSGLPALIARQLDVLAAQLALVSGRRGGLRSGHAARALPATPVQRWFLEHTRRPDHFNQSVLLELRDALTPGQLEHAVQQLVARHDALRLRAAWAGSDWTLHDAGPVNQARVEYLDLATSPAAERSAAFGCAALAQQRALSLAQGPLMRVLHADLGTSRRLLIVAHHLAVDVHSWRLLIEDLDALLRGQPARPTTSSFATWARRLTAYAHDGGFDAERAFWLDAGAAPSAALPVDRARALVTHADDDSVVLRLPKAATAALLAAARGRRIQVAALVLAALAEGLRAWTGQRAFRIDVEGHGREALFDDIDVAGSVGWFTAIYPLVIESRACLEDTLSGVVRRLAAPAHGGIGFGALRYLSPDLGLRARLAALPRADVLFNYHGRVEQTFTGLSLFAPAHEPRGAERDPQDRRGHALTVDASVDAEGLLLECGFSRQVHARPTIEALAVALLEALGALGACALVPPAVNPVAM